MKKLSIEEYKWKGHLWWSMLSIDNFRYIEKIESQGEEGKE